MKLYVIYLSNIQISTLFAIFCHFISLLFPRIRIFQENPQIYTDFERKPQMTQILEDKETTDLHR